LEGHPVVLEGDVHVVAEVLARLALQVAGAEPVTVPFDRMVGPIHPVRYPARIGLDADDLQARHPVKNPAENHGSDDVLAAADDPEEAVHLRATERSLRDVAAAGEDV